MENRPPLSSFQKQSRPPLSAFQKQNTGNGYKVPDTDKPLLQDIVDFLLPRATKVGQQIGTGLGIRSQDFEAAEQSRQQAMEMNRRVTARAAQEQDPQKRAELLQVARQSAGNLDTNTTEFLSQIMTSENSGVTEKDLAKGNLGNALNQGVSLAGETAAWLSPAGKSLKGASTLQKAGSSAATGAKVGAILGLTDSQSDNRLKSGATGAASGAATAGALSLAGSAASKVFDATKESAASNLRKIIRPAPSATAEFRATFGVDFADEILKKDGKNISGMNYDDLIPYFRNKRQAAGKLIDVELASSDKTISKDVLATKIQELIDNLAPGKGNVGTSGTVGKLQGLLKDLGDNPSELSLVQANNIKRQIQDLADEALSPDGKATADSRKIGELATFWKKEIEKLHPQIKELNRDAALYRLVDKGTRNTAEREANKITTSLVDKLLQTVPALAGLGGFVYGGPAGAVAATGLTAGASKTREVLRSPQMQTRTAANKARIGEAGQKILNSEQMQRALEALKRAAVVSQSN